MGANEIVGAVQAGKLEDVEELLRRDKSLAETRDENGVSLVLLALYHRQAAMAKILAGARSALDVFECAALGEDERLGQQLESDAGLAGARSPDGFTALHLACFFAQPECARTLLSRGADPNIAAANPSAVRPLHSAVAARQREIAQALLLAGADPNARQQRGFTALLSAAHIGEATLVELLLSYGADARLEDDDGKSAADHARQEGHPALAERLSAA